MPTATNAAQLRKMIMRSLQGAMEKAEVLALGDLYEETGRFYMTATPDKYRRTGQLANTPKTDGVSVGADSVEFKAYLDTSGGYSTGSRPGMETVLNWAADQSAGIVGGPLDFDRAMNNIINDVSAVIDAAIK